ncbi:Xaa-Pro aminopeptidase [uncultured Thiothrix sp.]|uniref:Xaa-Pro aminopeptidase n=1 Tax=uncultured Thiothrix sp. TaxID=223185 RepID=UPI0026112000|nr:Xaa-Pro aminopeptidase [uncultured Thiothrix sp.]
MKTAPTIPASEFAERRQRLLTALGENAIAIIQSSSVVIRNRDADFPFRQDSDFLYLTGFNEPNAVAVFIPGRAEGEYVLFCQAKDPAMERWTGKRAGVEGVVKDYGADQAFKIEELDQQIIKLLAGRSEVHYRIGFETEFDLQVLSWLNVLRRQARNGVAAPHTFKLLDTLVHEMRLFKSPAEIAMMRYAAQTAARAHTKAMQTCRSGLFEFEVQAEIEREFRKDGMEPSYTSIVGGGENACILHYVENRSELKSGDLLLIDAGSEHQGYASDITRSFPVSGRFTKEQAQLYQVVLDAQKAAIAVVKPGNNWDAPHQAAVRSLTAGLVNLGLLQGEVDELIKDPPKPADGTAPQEAPYRQFYMHKTGHWLGLDVHDVGDYKVNGEWRTLEPGMVLTVEPGLYVSPADNVDPKWWNIGIRIEDDVLVTAEGCEVLTAGVVKEIADIEALMVQ